MIYYGLHYTVAIYPVEFSIAGAEIAEVNGSSKISHCSNIEDGEITCLDPRETVVFDGVIPTLTALSTDTSWARELLTLSVARQQSAHDVVIQLNFTTGEMYSNDLWLIEIVHFNCPNWSIYIDTGLTIFEQNDMGRFNVISLPLATFNTSCVSLLNTTVSFNSNSSVFMLVFRYTSNAKPHWLHIAEIATYRYSNSTGPPTSPLTKDTATTPSGNALSLNFETIVIISVIGIVTILVLCAAIGTFCTLVICCLMKKQSHTSHWRSVWLQQVHTRSTNTGVHETSFIQSGSSSNVRVTLQTSVSILDRQQHVEALPASQHIETSAGPRDYVILPPTAQASDSGDDMVIQRPQVCDERSHVNEEAKELQPEYSLLTDELPQRSVSQGRDTSHTAFSLDPGLYSTVGEASISAERSKLDKGVLSSVNPADYYDQVKCGDEFSAEYAIISQGYVQNDSHPKMPSATAVPPLSMPSATAVPTLSPLSMPSATVYPPLSMPSAAAVPPLSMPSAPAVSPLSMPSEPASLNYLYAQVNKKQKKGVHSVDNEHYATLASTSDSQK